MFKSVVLWEIAYMFNTTGPLPAPVESSPSDFWHNMDDKDVKNEK